MTRTAAIDCSILSDSSLSSGQCARFLALDLKAIAEAVLHPYEKRVWTRDRLEVGPALSLLGCSTDQLH
jgi:hypothetical protein